MQTPTPGRTVTPNDSTAAGRLAGPGVTTPGDWPTCCRPWDTTRSPRAPLRTHVREAGPMTDEQPNAPETEATEDALPTDLGSLTGEQLAEALDAAQTEAAELRAMDPADMSDEQVARLVALADYAESIVAAENALAEAAEARATQAQEAAARIDAATATEPDPEAGDEPDPEAGDTPDEPEPEGEVEVPEVTDETPQAVAAAGRRPSPTRMRQPRNPQPSTDERPRLSLVAAADVPGIQAGAELADMSAVAAAFAARANRSFPQGQARQKGVRHQLQVASIHRNFDTDRDGLYLDNPDFRDEQAVFHAASQESRLTGGSLVAAGGWCAPSENQYGLCQNETLDGIINLPEVGVNRGGINYTPGPDFADIYTSAGFAQTEAEAIAGTTKDCVEVDCPDFSEVRLDAVGICVKAPLLTRAAYPELIQRWVEGTIVANQHKVAARLIAAMRTVLGTALAPTLTGTPITWGTLGAIELVIETQREAWRLSESESLEVIIPRWVRAAVRADLANRMGIGKESVSNADIQQHFADRGAAVQWVLNYLTAGAVTAVAYPATFEVMVYSAGTFVKGTADVVNLDTIYDTADLQTNVYTAAFVEDGVLLAKMCHGGKRITLPTNINGMLGAAQLDDNLFAAQAESAGA